MTPEEKAKIDSMTLYDLLLAWRNAPVGDPRFQGEHGQYWAQRMSQLRNEDNNAWVAASKAIGWH